MARHLGGAAEATYASRDSIAQPFLAPNCAELPTALVALYAVVVRYAIVALYAVVVRYAIVAHAAALSTRSVPPEIC